MEPAGAEAEVPDGEAVRTGEPAGYGRFTGEGLRGALFEVFLMIGLMFGLNLHVHIIILLLNT